MNVKGKKADVNIEFSHIYTSQTLGPDQVVGGKIAKQIYHLLYDQGLTPTTNVWIDDYNPRNKEPRISFATKYLEDLWKHIKFNPNYYAFEADAFGAGQVLLESIPPSLKKLKIKGKYNEEKLYVYPPYSKKISVDDCSLLSAAYAAAKCGAPLNVHPKKNNYGDPKLPFAGEKSITILPAHPYFIRSEFKAKKIISVSPLSQLLDSMHNLFFDPNLLPPQKNVESWLEESGILKKLEG